jgi:teichuronic acid biosynthesis glycosyltransferase TuaC
MKILVVTNMYPTSASPAQGTFVAQQVKSLKRLVDLEVLHIDRVALGKAAYFSVPERVRQAVSRVSPDVIHVMNGGALAFFTAATITRHPLVISFCGSDLLGDPQRTWRRRAIGQATVRASKIAARRADAIITKSRQLAAQIPNNVSGDKIHIIPNGVDLKRFRPLNSMECRASLGWEEHEFHVLFTGNPVSETKRHGDAVGAVELLREKGVPARLQLMRDVPHDQVPVWLNAAHVLVVCSIHEGSPNIVKESLACECPVVSTDVGDVGERIESIAGCYLYQGGVHGLTHGLEAVYRQGVRLTCRSKLASISLEAIAERIVVVYVKATELCGCARNQLRASGLRSS